MRAAHRRKPDQVVQSIFLVCECDQMIVSATVTGVTLHRDPASAVLAIAGDLFLFA